MTDDRERTARRRSGLGWRRGPRPTELARSAGLSVVAVWGPFWVPLFVGHVSGCSSCFENWLELLPVMPGLLVCVMMNVQDDTAQWLLSGAVTAVLFGAVFWFGRRSWRRQLWAAVPVVLWTGFCSLGLQAAFAM